MSTPALAYMQEQWFAVLQRACANRRQASVARQLGLSTGAISQILTGTGKYGTGSASTKRIAAKVIHVFSRFTCPHLTDESLSGADVVISAEQCRAWACRPAPTSSPRELKHWMACQKCPSRQIAMHLPADIPPVTTPVRKVITISTHQPAKGSNQ